MMKQGIYLEGASLPEFWAHMTNLVKTCIIEVNTKPVDPTERMTANEVCMYHLITMQTLRNWNVSGKLKPASRQDEKTYYLRGAVMAVPKKGKRLTTSEKTA